MNEALLDAIHAALDTGVSARRCAKVLGVSRVTINRAVGDRRARVRQQARDALGRLCGQSVPGSTLASLIGVHPRYIHAAIKDDERIVCALQRVTYTTKEGKTLHPERWVYWLA